MNFFEIISKKKGELSEIKFQLEENEKLKNKILSLVSKNNSADEILLVLKQDHENLVNRIIANSNVHLITYNKSNQEVTDLLEELILDLKNQNNLQKVKFLEKKLLNNLDENSYLELIKLKSQLNRD